MSTDQPEEGERTDNYHSSYHGWRSADFDGPGDIGEKKSTQIMAMDEYRPAQGGRENRQQAPLAIVGAWGVELDGTGEKCHFQRYFRSYSILLRSERNSSGKFVLAKY